jgi:hypothetical protein
MGELIQPECLEFALQKISPAAGGPRYVVAEFSLKNADATAPRDKAKRILARVPPSLGRKPDGFYKAP